MFFKTVVNLVARAESCSASAIGQAGPVVAEDFNGNSSFDENISAAGNTCRDELMV